MLCDLLLLCSNIVDFIGAGEVRPGDVPGAFACEFVVQVRLCDLLVAMHLEAQALGHGVAAPLCL